MSDPGVPMTTTNVSDVEHALNRSFKFVPWRPDSWILVSTFVYGDGDNLTVILERDETGWVLHDEGHTTSHLFYDLDFRYANESERAAIRRVASRWGIDYDNTSLSMRLDVPDAFDVADFIQIIAEARGAALEAHHD